MYSYSLFAASATKNRYETAFETAHGRVTYLELSQRVTAVYNSLVMMNATSCAVLLESGIDAVCAYFAASRAGIPCVSAGGFLSREQALELADKYRPSVVFISDKSSVRLADAFIKHGCTAAVLTGENQHTRQSVFPSEFDFSELLKRNDFTPFVKAGKAEIPHLFFDDCGQDTDCTDKITALPLRAGISVDLPFYENIGARALTSILYNGGKCCLDGTADRKITAVVTDRPYHWRKKEVIAVTYPKSLPFVRIGDSLFYPYAESAAIGSVCGVPVSCEYTDNKIRVIFTVDDIANIAQSQDGRHYASVCRERLAHFDCAKALVFRKKQFDYV